MFSKAPRFKDPKPSDIPGPGAYENVDIDEVFSHKRGAFLEKADRFDPDRAGDGPGPNSYAPQQPQAGPSKPPPMSGAVIRQQLEAQKTRLEKEHQKAINQLEVRASKAEARCQELNKEHLSLRSAASSAEREFRLSTQREASLKATLEKTEATLDQMRQRASNYATLQKKLADLESQHADSKKQHKAKIAFLESELESERSHHRTEHKELQLAAEATVQEALANARASDAERERLNADVSRLNALLEQASVASMELSAIQESRAEGAEEVLRRCTTTYSEDVSALKAEHTALRRQSERLEVVTVRLGRKLADREVQVTELTHLIRGTARQNQLLQLELADVNEQVAQLQRHVSYLENLRSEDVDRDVPSSASLAVTNLELQHADTLSSLNSLRAVSAVDSSLASHLSTTLSLALEDFSAHTEAAATYEARSSLLLDYSATLEQRTHDLEHDLALKEAESEQLEEAERRAAEVELALQQQVEEMEKVQKRLDAREAKVKVLDEALGMAKRGERAMQEQITSMESALNDAVKMQDEYQELVKRVDILVSRNALAEDEAQYLSQFNAHLLGHSNVNQRIFYVDRLRKEMSELKQKLISAEWERETTAERCAELIRELNVYRAVRDAPTTPLTTLTARPGSSTHPASEASPSLEHGSGGPPITHITRVGRQPLIARTNVEAVGDKDPSRQVKPSSKLGKSEQMTLAELSGQL